ncbi:hypothetical protein EHW71_02415 [Clostridium butyricum]|jgi:hypothetical protein|uniref:hypothetical protein n=1 Tax=Clostridium butyricum TaxID=1492 RepID=UPI000F52B15E|nr:hypothetical protein [Clostridium butyricum]RQN12489.1 hypothetical protein EHW71_02415 [Clostridium butyricum]
MINKLIIDTLKPIKIPIAFQKYSDKSENYITFHEYLAAGEEYEDDEETFTAHYIQVDVWSKADYTDVVKNIKELMLKAGFKRLNEIDLYEEDTKIYHKGLKFYYLEEGE